MISSIRHVGIVVNDLDRSLAFYCGLLGLKIYTRFIEEGAFIDELTGLSGVRLEWVKLIIPKGGLIELLKYHSPTQPSSDLQSKPVASNRVGYSHIALTVHGLDKIYQRLQSEGFPAKSPVLRAPGGKVNIQYCHDPDGNILELIEDLPSEPNT